MVLKIYIRCILFVFVWECKSGRIDISKKNLSQTNSKLKHEKKIKILYKIKTAVKKNHI